MFGSAIVGLCLVSTLTIAQSQSPSWHFTAPSHIQAQAQREPQSLDMTCKADDGKGNCTAAAEAGGPTVVVSGKGAITGQKMHCQDRGNMIHCEAMASTTTCIKDDGQGNCIAGIGTDGQVLAVTGEEVQTGNSILCIIAENTMHCTKLGTK